MRVIADNLLFKKSPVQNRGLFVCNLARIVINFLELDFPMTDFPGLGLLLRHLPRPGLLRRILPVQLPYLVLPVIVIGQILPNRLSSF